MTSYRPMTLADLGARRAAGPQGVVADVLVVGGAAFHVAHQMIRPPLAGVRPKRAPRPQISMLSPGSGTDPAGVTDRTAV